MTDDQIYPPPEGYVGFDPTSVPSHETQGNVHSTIAGEGEKGIIPTRSQQYRLRIKQLAEDLPLGLSLLGVETDEPSVIARAYRDFTFERELESGGRQKISPEEANKRYPDMPVPFSEPIYPELADLRYSSAQHRKNLQDLINRGDEIGFLSNLAVGSLGTLDPVNLLTGIGIGKLYMAAGVAPGFFATVEQGFLGNLAGELPAYFQNKRSNLEVSALETTKQAAFGAVGFTALTHSLGALFRVARKPRNIPESMQKKGITELIAQHESGQNLDPTPIEATASLRNSGASQPGVGTNSYTYRPLTHASEAAHYQAYGADTNGPVPLAPELGMDGIHATDHSIVANNHAGTPESQFKGKLTELAINPDAKLIKLDEPLPKSLIAQALAELRKFGIDEGLVSESQFAGMTGREVFQLLHSIPTEQGVPSPAQLMALRASSEGFHGYEYAHSMDGKPIDNRVYLFDESQVMRGETLTANRDAVPNPIQEEAAYREQAAMKPENSSEFNPEIAKQIEENLTKVDSPEKIDALEAEQEALARKILDHPDTPAEVKSEVAKIDEEFNDTMRTRGWAQVLGDCVMRGIL